MGLSCCADAQREVAYLLEQCDKATHEIELLRGTEPVDSGGRAGAPRPGQTPRSRTSTLRKRTDMNPILIYMMLTWWKGWR